MSIFKQATRKKLKARIAIEGPAGCGKTYTALRFAFGLLRECGGGRVAVVDTEHRSASKYLGEAPDGIPFKFDVSELEHFAPSTYANVVREAGRAGYDVLIIDSLSHAWEGVGGALDQVDRKAGSTKGGSFAAWRDVTPQHREMIETILASPCHVIVTMRSKMAYELQEVEKNGKKKMEVQKLGTKPIQREGVEYEFDVIADMDVEHLLTVTKSRCPALDGKKAAKPDATFMTVLSQWLVTGVDSPKEPKEPAEPKEPGGVRLDGKRPENEYSQGPTDPCGKSDGQRIVDLAKQLDISPEDFRGNLLTAYGVKCAAEIPSFEAQKLIAKWERRAADNELPF